ncbi:rhamnogalacturonan lyase [Bacteroides sp. f07]|uniref:rhamnogalacturonan lyase family protein n=1 Tax=Bacteroides sp. f07 TaxID=3132704 RepID=UPI0034C0B7E6
MKHLRHLSIIGILLLIVACGDEQIQPPGENGTNTDPKEEPGKEIIIGERNMWVSYDPTPRGTLNHTSGYSHALVSWRLLPTDPTNIAFDIYKSEDNGQETKLNETPVTNSTCWADKTINARTTSVYRVTVAGSEQTLCEYTFTPQIAETFYRAIRLNTHVPDPALTYAANDAQVGDLDGDGVMEIILKRQPYDGANQGGWREGTTLLEAYKLDGTFLWQIDMGINIRSGSHYTSFIVCDFDGDGKCEIAFRSSEGTRFANGDKITDANGNVNDYRQKDPSGKGWYSGKSLHSTCGLIFDGPEYISIVNGQGIEVGRTNNIPRGGEGSNYERAKYWHNYWGDDYGNRMDRFFIGAAYLDGIPENGIKKANPSVIITRGIYRNWQVWALDFNGSSLLPRWKFNTNDKGCESYRDMGSHTFRVADLNGDGYDEILYGSAAIARNGKGLYCTGNGHGDALHVGKFIPDRPGLQVVACFENPNKYINNGFGYGCAVFDAATGKYITGHAGGTSSGSGDDNADEEDEDKDPPGDVGRCLVADIIPDSPGHEYWSSEASGVYSCQTGQLLSTTLPSAKTGSKSYNNAIFWTGDLTRQMLDDVMVHSYTKSAPWDKSRVITFTYYGGGVYSNNSTKANPCYYGDFLGDYREEVIYRSKDGEYIYLFSSNHPTEHRFVHLMNDHTYDMSQAMQNVGYNQPTHMGYYIGADSK